mgnify:CR=1 FL=1
MAATRGDLASLLRDLVAIDSVNPDLVPGGAEEELASVARCAGVDAAVAAELRA